MGLDIFFYKRKFNQRNPNKPIGKDEDGDDIYEEMGNEIAYFRKVNFLMSYFEYMGDEMNNCYYKEIYKNDMEQLIEDCNEVLLNEDKILKGEYEDIPLQPTEGFFFGNTDIDDYFFTDVKNVKNKFTEILKNLNEDEQVFMYCWW